MTTLFNPTGNFKDNVAALEAELGHPVAATSHKLAKLSNHAKDDLLLAAHPGKFVSMALLQYLSGGESSFMIDGDKHQIVQNFFGPLWHESGHPTIDFLREPGARVEVSIIDNGFESTIDQLWERRAELTPESDESSIETLAKVLCLLDYGVYRIAEPDSSSESGWRVNEWLKKAILLTFKLSDNELVSSGFDFSWFDKIRLKCTGWGEAEFTRAGFRAVPGSIVRLGAYIGPKAILMPSFVNIGAYVDEGTMVDTWATVGSCAQIGKKVHISGGAGIGGVLEPLQDNPVIIEDEAFIGARSEVVEGVIVRKRAVLSMGVFIGKNTPIVDRPNGNRILRGEIPENAVVMMGVHPDNGLTCPHIVKYRDGKTDAATALNDILRG